MSRPYRFVGVPALKSARARFALEAIQEHARIDTARLRGSLLGERRELQLGLGLELLGAGHGGALLALRE